MAQMRILSQESVDLSLKVIYLNGGSFQGSFSGQKSELNLPGLNSFDRII